jgi:hypothetical protein
MIAWWVWVIIGVVAGVAIALILIRYRGRAQRRYAESRPRLATRELYIDPPDQLDQFDVRDDFYDDVRDDLLSKYAKLHRLDEKHWLDEKLSRAVRDAIRPGLLMFSVPAQMVQGKRELVEVNIARSADFREELISGLRGQGEPQFEEIDTSLYMEVKLEGRTFEITVHSPAEQLIIPTPARWEFDVLPCRAGQRQLTLYVNMRIEAEGIVGGRRGVSSLEKQIDVQVDIPYATRRFVTSNWQWLIPTVLALAGTVAAWLVVPF